MLTRKPLNPIPSSWPGSHYIFRSHSQGHFLSKSLVLIIIIKILTMPSSCESNSTMEQHPPLSLVYHLLFRSEEPAAWTPGISQRGSNHYLEHIVRLIDAALQLVSDGDETGLVLVDHEEGCGQDRGTSTRASSEEGTVKRGVPKQ
jgi:hypothetical protein